MSKLKLAILAQAYLFDNTAPINGTQVQLHNLAYGFKNNNIEVHYVCTTKDISKPAFEIVDNIHFHRIQTKPSLFEWKQMISLFKKKVQEINPDALYVRGRNVLQYVAGEYATNNNKVYVWGTNGDDSAEYWKNIKRLKNSKKSVLRKTALLPLKAFEDIYINKGMKTANVIVNQSVQQQKTTKTFLKREGIVLPSYFPKVNNTISKSNQILWLASLSANKQPEKYIDLINGIHLDNWEAILGGGTKIKSYWNQISKKAEKSPVKLIGKIDYKESFNYYQKAKIYINTSIREGLPNGYIQSWLSGTVVLTLHHDPNNWFDKYNIGYCAKGNLEDLKDKISELIANPEALAIMGKNAKTFAEKQFSDDTIIQSYINLFTNKV